MFLLRSLDSLLMIAGAKFDFPLMVTPSSLSGSNFGMSAPLLACFETDLKGVVKAVSVGQFLLGVYVLVAIAAFSLAATSVWSARKGHCPLMGFARSWLLPGFLATFQHYFMEFDVSVCIYLFAMFVAVSPSFFSAFSMLLPVSLVRELKSCERQEKTKQTCEVEDFMVPPCHSVGLTAVVTAAALWAAFMHYVETAAAASCSAFVLVMGVTFVILCGTVVASESTKHFFSLDGVFLRGASAPAAAAMVVVGTLVENGPVFVPENALVQQQAAAAMDEQPGVCQEVSVNALQAKATARVDVPETSKTQGYGVELEETEKVKKSFPVFLRTLQGRHQVLSCCADMLVADLYELVADSCHMHCERFMLVHQSKIVERSGALGEWGIERDATLTLTLRMLGGSGIPGEWHCALCNRGGCWHTKAWCFRCGTSRAESEAILRGSAQGFALPGKGSAKGKGIGKGVGPQPQREQRYPGRPAPSSGPQFSHAPTFHAPRPNKRKQADSSSPQLNALPQVVEVLKMLGCSQDILDMVKSKVDEQTKAQHKVPGEKERMLHVLKMKLTKAKSHLAHLQSVEKKKEEEYAHARDLAIEQARYLVDIQNQHDQAFQRVIEGSVVDSATSEGPILEEISDDEAQFQAMSDDDPDLAPKEWTQPEKRAQPEDSTGDALNPPPPPKFPRVLPAKIECTDAERAQVQAWDINSVQAMHNWCQERLAAACQATPEG